MEERVVISKPLGRYKTISTRNKTQKDWRDDKLFKQLLKITEKVIKYS